jgi:hypothetical protein
MTRQRALAVFFLVIWAAFSPNLSAEVGPAYAIVKCRVFPEPGRVIEEGAVLIRDGLITAVGSLKEVEIPPDADVLDAAGKNLYPGLIDAWTNLFLEIPRRPSLGFMQVFAGVPEDQQDDGRHADYEVFPNLKPKAGDELVFHKLGFTTVLSVPETGYVSGRSALLNLNRRDPAGMVVLNPVALHVRFMPARGVYPTSVMGTVAALRQAFCDASFYRDYGELYNRTGKTVKRPRYDPFLEDISPYILDGRPVVIRCDNQEDIKRALRLRREFGLHLILAGAEEAWRVAGFLEEAKVPLILSVGFKPPYTSIHFSSDEEKKKQAEERIYPANPACLAERGIPFALSTYGLQKKEDFFKQVRLAVSAGLAEEAALEALTIQPARILGIDEALGTLAPGKIANLVLTDGGIFQEKTRVEGVFVDGFYFELEQPDRGEGEK